MKNLLLIIVLLLISIPSSGQKAFHIYGGESHDVYLGCLNCDTYNASSIWNEYGNFGSRYNSKSIWNEYSPYGSEYSSTSPFNSYANYPPVIVDKDGNFYGYFTVNEYNSKRADFKLVNIICKNYTLIRENVAQWYEKIFN